MSKYKGQLGGKKGKKVSSPPPFQAMPERKHFFSWGLSLWVLIKRIIRKFWSLYPVLYIHNPHPYINLVFITEEFQFSLEQVLLNLLFAEFKMVGIVKEKEREIEGRLVNIIETLSNIIKHHQTLPKHYQRERGRRNWRETGKLVKVQLLALKLFTRDRLASKLKHEIQENALFSGKSSQH